MIGNAGGGPWIDFAGRLITYVREGTGRPILFYPNAVSSHALWDRQIERFRTSHDVVALETAGLAQRRAAGSPSTCTSGFSAA